MEDNNQQVPPVQPNWSLATDVICEAEGCGNNVFISGVFLKKLSKIAAATDRDLIRPIPTFACSKCGHVNKEFMLK